MYIVQCKLGYKILKEGVELPTIKIKCDNCGKDIYFHYGQVINCDMELAWAGGYLCQFCGESIEVDGETIPIEYREAILRNEGNWSLSLHISDNMVMKAIKIIRKAMELSMEETKYLKSNIPGTILKGTKVEMQRIQLLLHKEEIESEVVKEK